MQTELNKVVTALHEFYAREAFLLEKDLGERTLTHRLAVHVEHQFPGWETDCDYDRLGDRTLRLPHGTIISTDDHLGKSVYPDIVVHQRAIPNNLLVAIVELKKVYPNADYGRLTLVGHSNGGDISMYLARRHPEIVKKVVTLDNLRVPFATDGKFKILSFRSRDPVFKADPNVIPDDEICARAGITVVRTEFQHNDLSDRGPDHVKSTIQAKINQFLDDEEGPGPLPSAAASMATVAKSPRPMASSGPGPMKASEAPGHPALPNLAAD